ncbi:MAG: hypothetical protein IJC67_02955 [Clostridia bacterium]|nr:hypothetical protein [Clostridia bacterium]
MKKIIALLLVLAMVFALCACGAKELPVQEAEPTPTPAYEMPQIIIGEPEKIEEPEEPAVSEPVEEVSGEPTELTDDLFDFIFEIDGDIYQFPCSQEKFVENGWEQTDPVTNTLLPGEQVLHVFERNGLYLPLVVYNLSDEEMYVKDCVAYGFVADDDFEYEFPDIYMAKGVYANHYSYDSLIDAYGEPPYVSMMSASDNRINALYYTVDTGDNTVAIAERPVTYNFFLDPDTQESNYLWVQNCVPLENESNVGISAPAYTAKPVTLSDDLFDFTFKIDGVNYQLPCPVSVFLDNGWEFYQDEGSNTLGGTRDGIYSLRKDGMMLMLTFYNGSGDTRKLMDCSVGGIIVQPDDMYVDIYFGDGTLANTLTEKDVLKKYGEPTKTYDNYSRYDKEDDTSYIFWYKSGRAVDSIHIKNLKSLPGFDDSTPNPNPPAFYNEYVTPTALSDDIYSGTVEIDGDLYTLPIPIPVMMKNGWKFEDISAETLAAEATLYSSTTLSRNGKTLYVSVTNFSDRLSYVEDCCISEVIDYGFLKEKVNMKVPGGIKIGMSEKDLKNAMPAGYDTGNGTYYLYDHERNTDLWVQVEDGKVSAIQYQIDEWNR